MELFAPKAETEFTDFAMTRGMSRSDKGVSFGHKEVNGAFRPKGGNGVHGLCDDAGMSRSDKGVLSEGYPNCHPPCFVTLLKYFVHENV